MYCAGPAKASAAAVKAEKVEESSFMVETARKQMATGHTASALARLASALSTSTATSVRASGLGLKQTFAGRSAFFQVDASAQAAGNNMLLVGVLGPSTPCEEILVKHMGNRQYQVTYNVREKGQYVLVVKWGDQHVQGSPFLVDVV